jgi:Uma2 family endonuclease
MPSIIAVYDNEEISVPMGLETLGEFRRWFHTGNYPEKKRIDFIAGDVWIQPSQEGLLHNEICVQLLVTLGTWQRERKVISLLKSMRYTNLNTKLSTAPDLMYFSSESVKRHEVELRDGNDCVEVMGSPEIMVEVSSKFTYQRDTTVLRQQYWQAGVREYWLADSRKTPSLRILHRSGKQFSQPKEDAQGWQTSHVLQAKCKLNTEPGPAGTTRVTLEIKPSPQ